MIHVLIREGTLGHRRGPCKHKGRDGSDMVKERPGLLWGQGLEEAGSILP